MYSPYFSEEEELPVKIIFPQNTETKQESIQTGNNKAFGTMATVKGGDKPQKAVSLEKNAQLFGNGMNKKEKAGSFAELAKQAEMTDVGLQQDYQTLLSHTLSPEDYRKMEEEGFSFAAMEPEEVITIVDKIKAELVRSGQNIAGYTDDLSQAALTEILGSTVMANALSQEFARADIVMDKDLAGEIAKAWDMIQGIESLSDGAYRYMIDNAMSPEIQNIYVAVNSGLKHPAVNTPQYFTEDIKGYYSQSVPLGGEPTEQVGQNIADTHLAEQIDRVIEQAGFQPNEESRGEAKWLMEEGLALTTQNLRRYRELKEVTFPVQTQDFAKAVVNALTEGKGPIHANLAQKETIYERAVALLEKYSDVARVRLHMTAEVNVKLLKSGFSIDTAPMEDLVEALKEAKRQLADIYFPEAENAVEKYQTYTRTNTIFESLPALPADIVVKHELSVSDFHELGVAVKERYEQAQESYEAIQTSPRTDMGDSIRKAFGNVDSILRDMNYPVSDDNRRAVRILGYNRMEITAENLEQVKAADLQVRNVIDKMTPAAVLRMIRDGVNPLENTFEDLNHYFDTLPREYEENAESYSRFLYGLQCNNEITEEERESFIGIYRLLHQIEKADGAVVGALVNTQAQLHFTNLLNAVRSGKVRSFDVKVDEKLGVLTDLVQKGNSISEQILEAFKNSTDKLTEMVYSEEAREDREQMAYDQVRQAARVSSETIALLERGQVPKTAENLLAAQALLLDKRSGFLQRKEDTEKTNPKEDGMFSLWEKLDDKEAFQEGYTDALETAKEAVKEATLLQSDTPLQVRDMQLFHKQLTIAAALKNAEEYMIPMYLGEELTTIHLTIEQGTNERGLVDIAFHLGEEGYGEAHFSLKNQTVSGFLQGSSSEEVMKLQKAADIFSDYIMEETSYRMDAKLPVVNTAEEDRGIYRAGGTLRVVSGREFCGTTKNEEHKAADNRELYGLSKIFLQALSRALKA